MVEHLTVNQGVGGSNPSWAATRRIGVVANISPCHGEEEGFDSPMRRHKEEQKMVNLTVGELREKLESFVERDTKVVFENGHNVPNRFDSYRGYYHHVALDTDGMSFDKEVSVNDLLQTCISIQGSFVTGYKGGEFEIRDTTPVWVSDYGIASGIALTDVELRDGKVVLITYLLNDDERYK